MARSSFRFMTLDFNKITEREITKTFQRKFERALKHSEVTFVSAEAANKPKRDRTIGESVKTAVLKFSDGQTITLSVKGDGSVFQVKHNRTVVPLKSGSDIDKAVIEMADLLYDSHKSFKKAQEKKKASAGTKAARTAAAASADQPAVKTTAEDKLARAQWELDNAKLANESKLTTVNHWERQISRLSGEIDSLKDIYEAENTRTVQLTKQLDALRRA